MIILYNKLAQGRAAYSADQLIKLPPIHQIFREANMDSDYLVLIDEMISIATEYQEVHRQYFEIVGKLDLKALRVDVHSETIRVPIPAETKAKASELEKRLGVVKEKFKTVTGEAWWNQQSAGFRSIRILFPHGKFLTKGGGHRLEKFPGIKPGQGLEQFEKFRVAGRALRDAATLRPLSHQNPEHVRDIRTEIVGLDDHRAQR
jgi:hypothetical protein